jgi:hypothetical protein
MSNPDHISESLETIFWAKIPRFFDADPGWKKFGSGINIQDLQNRSVHYTNTVQSTVFENIHSWKNWNFGYNIRLLYNQNHGNIPILHPASSKGPGFRIRICIKEYTYF